MQCLGRLQSKDVVYFEAGPKLHRNKPLLFLLPRRCLEKQSIGDLCTGCNSKREATKNSLDKRGNKYIPNQACLLHGTIAEPIPIWSRLYNGVWWHKQIETGYTASAETLEKAEKAFSATHKDNELSVVDMKLTKTAESAKEGTTPKKMTRKRAQASVPVVNLIKLPEEVPVVVPVVTAVAVPVLSPPLPIHLPKEKKARKAPVKKSVTTHVDQTPMLQVTNLTPIIPTEVIDIKVERIEMADGQSVWLNKDKDKVYDLKFNYLGRLKDEAIDSSFPDSDNE